MKDTARSLERKLNEMIDDEIAKAEEADDRLILACCDGLLRLDDVSRYEMSAQSYRENLDRIVGVSDQTRKKRKTIRTLLIAAALAALLALAALGYAQVKYDIFRFSDHSTVRFHSHNAALVSDLNVGYVPSGFVLRETQNMETMRYEAYARDDLFFSVSKEAIHRDIDINTEYGESRIIRQNGVEYIAFGDDSNGRGFLWVVEEYEYSLVGNLSDEELLKIALSVH